MATIAANMAKPEPVTHVIFDMDGLLLDTETLYTEAVSTVSKRYGKNYTWEIKVKCMGKTFSEAAAVIIDELGLPLTIEEYKEQIEEEYQKVFLKTELLPGVERLVRHLYKKNVPMAVATSSNKFSFDLKTKKHQDFFKLFGHIVLGSNDPEIKQGKPAPDTFLVCCSRFSDKPSPNKVLVFEDSPIGVEAAVAAGMQVVMIPDPRVDPSVFEKATVVLNSMLDFRPEIFGLPPFEDS
ncbi:pseudouridine-5'-phosphatase-like [Centruroides sculpturatus]|uniref:pseudouridine-5'-phosphatase-like n=1 Tax=Centruroides sculpturatus TaxID=218467 RepID=UPI000C6D8781|nr:pseudouridine-5'-phosphatase-like [Centruroides sculpturatus]